MKLLASTKNKITNGGENGPYLKTIQVVLIHCNAVNNNYRQNSRVLYTFVPNQSYGELLDISPKNFYIFKKHLNQNFQILKYGLLIKIAGL